MPRPRKLRTIRIDLPPRVFKPRGVPMTDLHEIALSVDRLEALRLADADGLEHGAAADLMNVSRPTFSRLLAEARTAVATALVQGWAIRIEGGAVQPAVAGNASDATAFAGLRRRRGHCYREADRRAAGAIDDPDRADFPAGSTVLAPAQKERPS